MRLEHLHSLTAAVRVAALAGLCWLGAGCGPLHMVAARPRPGYAPDNFHRAVATLPRGMQRVAVLPLTCEPGSVDLAEGRTALEPALRGELMRTKKFAVVEVGPEVMRSRTGRANWTEADTLPVTFFDSLREGAGCDGVLFCELTVFRPQAPLAVGWRLRLVDVRTQETVWAVDEIFDAREAAVATDARRFEPPTTDLWGRPRGDSWALFNSPRRFGQYAAATVLATLPAR